MAKFFLFFLVFLMIKRVSIPASFFVYATECSRIEMNDVRFIRDTITGAQTAEIGFPGLDQHIFVSVGRPPVSAATSTIAAITTTPTATTTTTSDSTPSSYIEWDYCPVVCETFSRSFNPTLESDLCGPGQSYCVSGFCTHLYLVPLDDGSSREGLINSEIESDLTDEETSNPLPCSRALEVVTVSRIEPTTEDPTTWSTTESTIRSTTESTIRSTTEPTTWSTTESTIWSTTESA